MKMIVDAPMIRQMQDRIDREPPGPERIAGSTATGIGLCQHPVDDGGRDVWAVAIHEAGHVGVSRYLNLDVAGSTVVARDSYSGLTWGPGSRRVQGKAADGSAAHDAVALRVAGSISRFMPRAGSPAMRTVCSPAY